VTPTLVQKSLRVALGSSLVFLVLWWWTPSDRGTVAACIRGMVEASRGSGFHSEYRDQLVEVEQAKSITITRKSEFGAGLGWAYEYTADGQSRLSMCGK